MHNITIPTDSLYKLLAVSGVVIVVTACLYSVTQHDTIAQKEMVLSGEKAVALFEMQVYADQANRAIRRMSKAQGIKPVGTIGVGDGNNGHADANAYSVAAYVIERLAEGDVAVPEQLQKDSEWLLDRAFDVDRQAVVLHNKQAEIDLLQGQRRNNKWILIIGLILGSVLFVFGLALWYMKVQRYQDRILIKEANRQA